MASFANNARPRARKLTAGDREWGESIGLHPRAVEPIFYLYQELTAGRELNKLGETLFVLAAKAVNALCKDGLKP